MEDREVPAAHASSGMRPLQDGPSNPEPKWILLLLSGFHHAFCHGKEKIPGTACPPLGSFCFQMVWYFFTWLCICVPPKPSCSWRHVCASLFDHGHFLSECLTLSEPVSLRSILEQDLFPCYTFFIKPVPTHRAKGHYWLKNGETIWGFWMPLHRYPQL